MLNRMYVCHKASKNYVLLEHIVKNSTELTRFVKQEGKSKIAEAFFQKG